ncbi:MAG: hypothetical protein IJJ33_17285 [Victivallales bacterium]|nr:hypothetical protein [Victivallales bacterium]
MFDKDHAAKVMFGNSEAVANLINEAFFRGKEYFHPEQFHALPTDSFLIETKNRKGNKRTCTTRDAFWQCDTGDNRHICLLFGLEFQSSVDYFMPGRLFIDAALNIHEQHRRIAMKREAQWGKRGYPSTEEYLSRFGKGDKVVKPLAVVAYFGGDGWDGPKSLNDISSPLPPELAEYDYDMKAPVVDLDNIPIERVRGFEQNLKLVLLYAIGRKEPGLLRRIVAEEPGFRKVPHHVATLIQALFHTKFKIPNDKEDIDMCLAEEMMIEEGRKKGMEDGLKQGMEDGLKQGMKDGLKQGMQDGLKKGMQDGLKKGMQEGMLKGAERYIQMCRNNNTSRSETLLGLKSIFLLSPQKATALLRKA